MMIPGGGNHSVYPNHSNSYNFHHILRGLGSMIVAMTIIPESRMYLGLLCSCFHCLLCFEVEWILGKQECNEVERVWEYRDLFCQ